MTAAKTEPTATGLDILPQAQSWLTRDGKVAIATVVDTWGSSPVPVGGQMVVATDGEFQGSVSGGCIEGEIISEAGEVLQHGRPRSMTFGVSDDTAWSVGLPCGGKVRVFVEQVGAGTPGASQLTEAIAARSRRQGLVLKKRLDDASAQMFYRDDAGVPADIAERFSTAKSGIVVDAAGEVFLHALVPPARIVAIGATHITQVLSALAKLSGYDIQVIDPRTAFASEARFPGVKLHAEWPQDALPRIGLDPYTVLCVLAHVEHIDDEALKFAVKTDCRFIAALGSGRNHAKRRDRLLAAGITEAEFARIKNPIGLDIGAQTPAEIALAVMAEVVQAVRGRKAKG